jgi:hypothetical protein
MMLSSILPFSGGGFSQDAGGAGDECLYAGHPDQIGRIRVGGVSAMAV